MTLDFPPMGSRDEANKPVGFDVDYCNDLAKVLGVDAESVETPFPDRIPALVSGRADIIVATEGFRDLLPPDGYTVDAGPDWGYAAKDGDGTAGVDVGTG